MRQVDRIISRLKSLHDPAAVEGMARFGITGHGALGISIPVLRRMARELGRDHELALGLWASGIHEARILASMVEDPARVGPRQMDRWARDFDSWDVCDQVSANLFRYTPHAWNRVLIWPRRKEEFVRRAGFALMACLATGDKKAADESFTRLFPIIIEGASDERNMVKKAVNWALRQIGKRNLALNAAALETCQAVRALGTPAARWIASDALRELTAKAVQGRLRK